MVDNIVKKKHKFGLKEFINSGPGGRDSAFISAAVSGPREKALNVYGMVDSRKHSVRAQNL